MRCHALPVVLTALSSLACAGESPGPAITMAAFGERTCNPRQTFGDTWDTAWLVDGRVLVQYNDGSGFNGNLAVAHHDGVCELKGTPEDIATIAGIDLNPGRLGNFLGATYSTGLYSIDNALYHLCCYSVQIPGAWKFYDTNLYKSVDGGATWLNHRGEKDHYIPASLSASTFPDRRWGEVDFVKYGRGGVAPDLDRAREFAYLTCGDLDTYLARVRRSELSAWDGAFDRSRIEYYCGAANADGMLDSNWTREISRCTPIRKGGCPGAMVWNPGLRRYLMTAFAGDSWENPPIRSTLFIYEAPHPWGPWTEVNREYTEPRVGDTLGWFFLMQAFMSPDGTRMWATVAGRQPYGLQFLPVFLTTQPVETRLAGQAEREGTVLSNAVKGSVSPAYIDAFNAVGDGCAFTIPVTATGMYALRYRYYCNDVNQTISLSVNGRSGERLALGNTLQSTLPWNEGSARIWLTAGTTTIQFHVAPGDRANNLHLDRIQLALLSTAAVH